MRDILTAIIIIDENGDLGPNGSKYFAMGSVISESTRNLRPLAKSVSSPFYEKKFSWTERDERVKIISIMSELNLKIAYIVVDKNMLIGKRSFGVKLYRRTLEDLIDFSLNMVEHRDVHIIVDSSYNIKQKDLVFLCKQLCDRHGKHLNKCYKGISQKDP